MKSLTLPRAGAAAVAVAALAAIAIIVALAAIPGLHLEPAAAAASATATATTAPDAAHAATGTFVVRGARVFDGVRSAGVEDVLVRDGHIATIGAVGSHLAVPAGTDEISGAGRTLLPGLIDCHTHTWGTALHDTLIFGVTTTLDMFMAADNAKAIKADQSAGKRLDEADLRSAGTLATAPGGHGTEYGLPIPTLTKPEEAQAWVDARIAEGSDYIKIVIEDGKEIGHPLPTLDAPTVAAIVAAAHKRGKLVVVHVETQAAAREAIDAGADGLAHLFIDEMPDPGFGRYVAAHHAFVIPTLSVFHYLAGAPAGAALVHDPNLEPYVGPDTAANLTRSFPSRPGTHLSYAPLPAAVKQLLAAGVPILAGTDSPNPGTAAGVSLHGELALLVEAGLTPVQALAAATSVPARIFHVADRGRIAPGLRADLLLVEGDPTTDIVKTRAIVKIWKLGVEVNRSAAQASVGGANAVTGAFGAGWSVSTDQLMGGKSTASLAVSDDLPTELATASPAVPASPGTPPAATSATSATPRGLATAPLTASGMPAGGRHSLAIRGTVVAGGPVLWAGAAYSPGPANSAVDLSKRQGIHLWAKGDGRTYQVMVFAQSKGFIPLVQSFVAGSTWKRYDFPWSAFDGIDGHDIILIAFTAADPPGSFAMQLAGVRIE